MRNDCFAQLLGCAELNISIIECVGKCFEFAYLDIQGLCKLPSYDVMMADIKRKQMMLRYRYVNSPRHTIQVDWVQYMDEIAEQVGCKPEISECIRAAVSAQ